MGLRCPKCGSDQYRLENMRGKAYCPICGEAFNENQFRWLRARFNALLAAAGSHEAIHEFIMERNGDDTAHPLWPVVETLRQADAEANGQTYTPESVKEADAVS